MGGLAKGLEVIRAFTRDKPALTLSEVAAAAGLSAATARRCLHTLEELGYVMRNGRSFLLRPKVLELGSAYLESMDIESLTRTSLEDLARTTGDSAALTVLDGHEIVYVARASVRTLMRLEAHVGSRFPAYPTSMGRVLLAGLSAPRLERYFAEAKFEPLTEHTVTDPGKTAAAARGMPPQWLCGGGGRARLRRRLRGGAGVRCGQSRGGGAQQLQPLQEDRQGQTRHASGSAILREVSRNISRELAHIPSLARSALV